MCPPVAENVRVVKVDNSMKVAAAITKKIKIVFRGTRVHL